LQNRKKRIKSLQKEYNELARHQIWADAKDIEPRIDEIQKAVYFINTLEVKEVNLEKESELIANGIMISVQSNKYGTNIYNTERNDFNHYHLQMAARKGIELGLKAAQKGE
jgi:hypothetical protein